MRPRNIYVGAFVVMAVVLAWLSITGVPNDHPLSALVGFTRIAVLVVFVVLVLLLVFVPAVRVKLLGRFGGHGSTGLSKTDRALLSKGERQSLAIMSQTLKWSEAAGVSYLTKTSKGDPQTLVPRVMVSEITAQGPAVTVHIVMGTVPSQYDDERISAALGLPIKCEQVGPAQVRIQLLSRDPLSKTRNVKMPVGMPRAQTDDDLTGWSDADLEDLR